MLFIYKTCPKRCILAEDMNHSRANAEFPLSADYNRSAAKEATWVTLYP